MPEVRNRVAKYAFRYWRRKGLTQWPTVRQCARALDLRHCDIFDAEPEGTFMTTGHNFAEATSGDLFVEASTEEVDVEWCRYWLPVSPCSCGRHERAT